MTRRTRIEAEVNSLVAQGHLNALDIVRRQKMERVQEITGRALVTYATDFEPQNAIKGQLVGGAGTSINLGDKDGFDDITRNLTADNGLDIILHSPGGSAEATESIVALLRSRFPSIRFIIPSVAKSAATMLALSGDQLLMDEVSELGPIDPQMAVIRERNVVYVPAQAIKDQFENAQREIQQDNTRLPAWVPILRELSPALLAQCDNHTRLAETLVSKWLAKYMFAKDAQAEEKANRIAHHLIQHNIFSSHARRVGIEELQELGVNILDMRTQPALLEAVRDLYTALIITLDATMVYKVFENSEEGRYLMMNITPVAPTQPQQPQPRPQVVPHQEGEQTRAERRRQGKEQKKQTWGGKPGR